MLEESVSLWASMNSWFTPTVLFLFLNLMIGTIVVASNLGSSTQKDQDHQQNQGLARSPSVLQRIKSINLSSYRSPEPQTTTNFEKPPDFTDTHFPIRHQNELEQTQLLRSPSFLQRLKSINFRFPQDFSNQPQPTQTQEPESHFEFKDEDFIENHEDPESPEPEIEEEEEEEEEQSLDDVFRKLQPLHEHHVNRTKSDTKPASGEVPTKLPKKMKKSASAKSAFGHFQEEDIVESLETRRPATVKERKAKVLTEDEEVDAKADDFINKFKNQLKLQRLDSIMRYKDMISRGSDK